jgi:hypothetical protein
MWPSKLIQAQNLLNFIRKVRGSNLGQETDYPVTYRGLSQSP